MTLLQLIAILALLLCVIIIYIGAYFIGKHLNSIDDEEIKEYRHWEED